VAVDEAAVVTARATILAAMLLQAVVTASAADIYREIKVTTGATIQGVVKWEGELPKVEDFAVYVDTHFCARSGSKANDRVVIDPETRVVKDVFVYLADITEGKPFAESRAVYWPHRMQITACSFAEHVVPAAVGRMVRILNDDQVVHVIRVVAPDERIDEFDLAFQGGEAFIPIRTPGFHYVTCRRHPWESAVIAAMEHPYYAITDQAGSFVIDEVPAGKYKLVAWHESMQVVKTMRGGHVTGYSFPPGFEVSTVVQIVGGKEQLVEIPRLRENQVFLDRADAKHQTGSFSISTVHREEER
jgi:hypothetical protein